ncbi:hypothetical protein GG496_001039 [Candidatus Fervidibacteria bacterium JGI MDM2 JNZ-1-D12]
MKPARKIGWISSAIAIKKMSRKVLKKNGYHGSLAFEQLKVQNGNDPLSEGLASAKNSQRVGLLPDRKNRLWEEFDDGGREDGRKQTNSKGQSG